MVYSAKHHRHSQDDQAGANGRELEELDFGFEQGGYRGYYWVGQGFQDGKHQGL